jgi:hypothetical protein
MMNALRICTHATQTRIVLTLLVHTPVNVEMVILAMVAYVQVILGAFQIYFDTPIMSQLVYISDIFRYANYVIAGICYIIVCLWKHHVNLLRTNMFYRHANIQRTGICYVLLSPLLDINECSTQTYTCDQCGLH